MNTLEKVLPFVPWLSLAASFVAAAVASYVLVAHFQHTILSASSTPGSNQALVDETYADSVAVGAQPADDMSEFICGCPFCCGIVE